MSQEPNVVVIRGGKMKHLRIEEYPTADEIAGAPGHSYLDRQERVIPRRWLLYGAIAAFLAALTIFVLSVKGYFPNF